MQPKTLTGLFFLTLAAVGLAIGSTWARPGNDGFDRRGDPVFPDLARQANQITGLTLEAGDWRAELRREGDRFIDASGYPVRTEPVRAIVTGLSTLSYEEPKTRDPDRYGDLDLADPDAATGAGQAVRLLEGDDTLAAVIVGQRDLSVGGMRGGVFVRLADQPQSWLMRGSVTLPAARSALFDAQLLGWNADDVAALDLADAGASLQLRSARAGEPLQAAGDGSLPLDADKVEALRNVVTALRFTDVRKADTSATPAGELIYRARNGIVLKVQRLVSAQAANEQRWLRLTVSAAADADDTASAQLASLQQRLEGFDFAVAEPTWETLSTGPAQLASKADE